MADPLILVTGSTDGIGKATATALAAGGSTIILHGRDEKKGNEVRQELAGKTGSGRPDLVIADYTRQTEIRRMAADIRSRYSHLDVIINNAGTYQGTRHVTENGIEMTFAVNYLGPFLLTRLLRPLLRKGSRIVTVASGAHFDVDRIDWENLPGQRQYDPWRAYALSKLADVTFTYTLARNLEGTGITANCLHPGVVDTKLLRSAFPGYPAITPEKAAEIPVWLARSPDVAGVTGRYFENKKETASSPLSRNRKVQARLWTMAEDLTGNPDYQ
ncbi:MULTISPECIES: SDR family NAD(P)-dependent oxidoreductase [unclassified Methanoregula]|uniref:SDR family NAD(P)-dependent oxidoreductase n=1 Tax=unclassified Methanoregula TaxID=2649730 RepID=UPI0025F5C127|nr:MULTISPECIES: SDR family NAD(P)-dependent oxidoreductase [unclassified Methanoregula]